MRGGSYGFKLKDFINAAQLKSDDNTTNLMLFIIERIEQDVKVKNKDDQYEFTIPNKHIELCKYAADITFKQIQEDIADIRQNNKHMSDAIKSNDSKNENDKIA